MGTRLGDRGTVRDWLALLGCVVVLVAAQGLAFLVQRDFGRVNVSNVVYRNETGIRVRAKLFKPADASPAHGLPAAVFVHGYQCNRETSDAYCIELARRGFVVLGVDAIGRGNSGMPGEPDAPGFDPTFGGRASFAWLRRQPFVDSNRVGVMGHSLGAEMVYKVALSEPAVKALVIIGFAYTAEATARVPPNMLMIFGKWDEYRKRMTGTRDFGAEWMSTPQTAGAIPVTDPKMGATYGSFADGTARRVVMPMTIHILETHDPGSIAEALNWMRSALQPDKRYWICPARQVWHVKEWATLVAMLAGLACIMPLAVILLRTRFFASLVTPLSTAYVCAPAAYVRYAAVNGLLMWLYLPLIGVLLAVHTYVVRIDRVFPMMVTNGVVWWFLWVNLAGLLLFRRWFRRRSAEQGLTLADLGISYRADRFSLAWAALGRTALLALALWAAVYGLQSGLEALFLADFRFVFPFASDLTGYRALLMLLYLPFLLAGFVVLGFFLYGQLRLPQRSSLLSTWAAWSLRGVAALVMPLALLLAAQYVPLLTANVVPLVGPSGTFVLLVINLFHIAGVLAMVVPLSTWLFLLSGRPYLGAMVSALLVAWMFASSQVVAPVPIAVK